MRSACRGSEIAVPMQASYFWMNRPSASKEPLVSRLKETRDCKSDASRPAVSGSFSHDEMEELHSHRSGMVSWTLSTSTSVDGPLDDSGPRFALAANVNRHAFQSARDPLNGRGQRKSLVAIRDDVGSGILTLLQLLLLRPETHASLCLVWCCLRWPSLLQDWRHGSQRSASTRSVIQKSTM